jgi:ankyrin repeat protein
MWLLTACGLAVAGTALAVWWYSPGQQQKRRNATLIEAARSGDAMAAAAALDAGAAVNSRDVDGITPLMHAVRGGRPEIANPAPTDRAELVELLIKRGADVNARTDSGFVALFWAARYGHVEAAKALIDHGADVNARDKDGLTAISWASTNHQTKMVELLTTSGAKD